MKVMVIGCGGYMGRHLMSGLARAGIESIGISSADGSGVNPDSGLLPEDFTVPPDTSCVVYLAQSPRYRQVPEHASHVLAVNSLSAVRVATAARKVGVSKFIYVSTGTVYAPSFSPIPEMAPVRRDSWYVLSKLHGEESLALFRTDMQVIVIRPFGIYGANQSGRLVPNLIDSVASGRTITLQPRVGVPDDQGGLKISLCYIDDAINILMRLIRDGGPVCLNLAGPEALSIRDISETIGRCLGREPRFEIASSSRDSDLIADIGLLERELSPTFTPFAKVMETILATESVS